MKKWDPKAPPMTLQESERLLKDAGKTVTIRQSFFEMSLYATGLSFIFLVGSLGWQSYTFFRMGYWPDYNVIQALWFVFPGNSWLWEPSDWKGIHMMFKNVHAGIFVFLSCVFITWASAE